MLPLKDWNPTRRIALVTILLIVASVFIFWRVQPTGRIGLFDRANPTEELAFTVENAAIPCELVEGRPLTQAEFEQTFIAGDTTACHEDPATGAVFPGKNVFFAVVVSMFLHGSWMHLLGNMLYLWVFGNNIEDRWGKVVYAGFYLLAGFAATVAHVAVQPSSTVPVVGASGAIAGVMGAYLVLFPGVPIRSLIFLGFFAFLRDVPAWLLLGFWFVSQFFVMPESGVAWMAHVGGFVFGVAAGIVARVVQPPTRPPRRAVGYQPY